MYNESREVLIDWIMGNVIGLVTLLIINLVFKLNRKFSKKNSRT